MSESENHGYRALFEHVGVSDLTDWKTVALRLAERYAPETLNGATRRKPGRPEKWDFFLPALALRMVREVMKASEDGVIRRRLPTKKSACEFLTDGTPEARAILAEHLMPEQITFATLYNRVCHASSFEKRLSQKP